MVAGGSRLFALDPIGQPKQRHMNGSVYCRGLFWSCRRLRYIVAKQCAEEGYLMWLWMHSLDAARCSVAKWDKKQSINQGLASPRLNWDGRDGLGHGVPVPGADGYEYVRWEIGKVKNYANLKKLASCNREFFFDGIWIFWAFFY